MSHRIILIAVVTLGLIGGNALAQHVVPSALLTIDQNRATVIERVVGEWGNRLASSNAGISGAQLRQILSGLRSDHLLAASLAGSVEGLRDVVSGALVRTDVAVSRTLIHTKSLGDTTDDLVYTPVVPCRIVDTRLGAGGVFLPQTQRNWQAYSPGGFASQGGSATNCGIPVRPVAVMMNTTLANTVGGPEFFELWPFNQTRPTAATVNWSAPAQQPANAEIVPLCTGGGCTSDFSAYASGQTQAIIDVLGYFNRPTNYGGTHTITGGYATDSGGYGNSASGDYSTLAGGYQNTASAADSTVGGGSSNAASGASSSAAGGLDNIASGDYSTVVGGYANTASGSGSTVAGGEINTASGDFSFAAGVSAHADATGCFAFSNWSNGGSGGCLGQSNVARFLLDHGLSVDYYSRRTDGGGTRFVYIGDLFPGQTIATWTGAFLSDGGAWVPNSDRGRKTAFADINPQRVLDKVARLPITTWSYKAEDATIRHLGPMAQDFYATFGIGYDGKHIADVDEVGVALAAIQGLHQTMRQQMREKDKELAQLRRKLQAIEAKLGL
jgi:Chaperone of endosialidase